MKCGNIEKWENIAECNNLLFFSQLVNELLFDYSIPSNRFSTLNSHYLCLDALRTIYSIETKGIHEGNLKHIAEELYSELSKDPVFKTDNHPTDYFVKYQKGRYIKTTNIQEFGYEELRAIVSVINELFFTNDRYFEELKIAIIRTIKDNKKEDQQCLFRMTKSLMTELTNRGYSTRYIYMVMKNLLWEPISTISSTSVIDIFFKYFNFQHKEYSFYYKVNKRKISRFLSLVKVDLYTALPKDLSSRIRNDEDFLNNNDNEGYLCLKWKALDPFAAEELCKENYELNVAVLRLYDHSYNYQISSDKCYAFDGRHIYKMSRKKTAVEHIRMPSNRKIADSMVLVTNAINTRNTTYLDKQNILAAIHYHAHALDSQSLENQLLDFWAIFESVLGITNKHTMDRINQICLHLVPILKQYYIYSLFQQLKRDIKNYNEDIYNEIIVGAKNEGEEVIKLCEFILLESNQDKFCSVIDACTDFPLLQERINYYHNVLATPAKAYDFVEKHADRVRWQILRIYRNRNLIIHNGERMPYLPLLIENLHSYVDDFLAYTIQSLAEGKTVDGMCQELFAKECRWRSSFQGKKDAITKENVFQMLSM